MANLFKSTEARLVKGLPRTRFGFEKRHTTSFDAGRLIPLLCVETLPGDTWKIDVASLIRMQTPIAPIMDDIYMDYYFFFVPNRVISNAAATNGKGNFEKVVAITSGFNGVIDQETIPALNSPNGSTDIKPGCVGDYLGLPIGHYSNTILNKLSSHPSLGYTMIYNYYFRDENYQTEMPLTASVMPAASVGTVSEPSASYNVISCLPYQVNNYHNLFTSVLPSPQKGPAVTLPLGDRAALKSSNGSPYIPVNFSLTNPVNAGASLDVTFAASTYTGGAPTVNGDLVGGEGNDISAHIAAVDTYVDLANATAASINQLREAVLMQQFLETAARSGTRYKEFIKGFFGVDIGDATIQQPEFIAEWHMNINVAEVVQTSGINAEDGTALGTTGAVSRSAHGSNNLMTYSSTEYGYLYCVACVRHKLSYSQGIEPMWTRRKGTDFYNPAWEGIGEVGIKTRQVLAPVGYESEFMKSDFSSAGSSVGWDDELGFNEPFAEYKYFTNRTSGILNPVAKDGLDYWTLTTAFNIATVSGAQIRIARKNELDRALSIQNQPQFIGDILFHGSVVRKMRKFSRPGIDRI